LFAGLPVYTHNAAELLGIEINIAELQRSFSSQVGSVGRNALQVTGQVFGGVFALLTIVVLSFYLLLEHKQVKKTIASFFAKDSKDAALLTLVKIEEQLGAWLRGQILLSVVIGLFTWIGLTLLGMEEYALPLALLAGLLEIVPTIGPIIAAIPGIIIALSISPTVAILVTVFYIILQILENNFIVPRIMEKAVGLNPIVIILGIIIGGKLLGILGALLAVPFIALVVVIASEIRRESE
jgi:predicted PurR-regulated permease PerM